MKTSKQDKYITFQNKLYNAEKEISAMNDPFIEAYNPSVTSFKESLMTVFEEKTATKKNHINEETIVTGLKMFDVYSNRVKKGELTILGINSLYFSPVATIISSMLKQNHLSGRVGVISARNPSAELVTQLLSILTNSSKKLIENMILSDKELTKVKKACEKIYDEPLFINNNMFPTIEEFKAAALKLRFEYDIQLLLVDSFECVGKELSYKNDFDKERRLTRFLKELAKIMEIPIIAVSHFFPSTMNVVDYAASGISFMYADNIIFCEIENITSQNDKLDGMVHILKGKAENISYSIKYDIGSSGLEECF